MRANTLFFAACGCAMLIALVLWLFPQVVSRAVLAVLFTVAALGYTVAQGRMRADGDSASQRRLNSQLTIGGVMLIATGLIMCNQAWHCTHWLTHNEWMVSLAIACVFQVYPAFRSK